MKSPFRKVDSFDGQVVTVDGKPCYELGGFLGGGAAGVVYEGADVSDVSQVRPVAIKILNPVGFRLAPALTLRRCVVARRGQVVASGSGSEGGAGGVIAAEAGFASAGFRGGLVRGPGGGLGGVTSSSSSKHSKLGPEHVWWLVSPNTKQVLAAYVDPRYGTLVEIPLTKCIEIWGLNPRTDAIPSCESPNSDSRTSAELRERDENAADGDGGGAEIGAGGGAFEVQVDGIGVSIPWLPPKYVQWLAQRRKVKREINNMGRVGGHRNVVELLSVLELIQDSKSTLFLILELVTGGELLDHIRLLGAKGFRAREASALREEGATQRYFRQLLAGLAHCHRQGVCHRDLSPSNLLLAESPLGDSPPVLKVADFGLSACCAGNDYNESGGRRSLPQRVRSVVGSPHYMAPEVTSCSAKGYDPCKADAWSCGIVLYTMLTATLPFDRDLARCSRFKRYKNWAEKHAIGATPLRATSCPATAASPCEASLLPSSSSPAGASLGVPAPSSPPVPPAWLFPATMPPPARSLLVSLLVPNPSRRMSVEQALNHPWLVDGWEGEGLEGGGGGNNDRVSVSTDQVSSLPDRGDTSTTAGAKAAAAAAAAAAADASGSALSGLAQKDASARSKGTAMASSGPAVEFSIGGDLGGAGSGNASNVPRHRTGSGEGNGGSSGCKKGIQGNGQAAATGGEKEGAEQWFGAQGTGRARDKRLLQEMASGKGRLNGGNERQTLATAAGSRMQKSCSNALFPATTSFP